MSAREKYRRPSFFALLLGSIIAFAGWVARLVISIPRLVLPLTPQPLPKLVVTPLPKPQLGALRARIPRLSLSSLKTILSHLRPPLLPFKRDWTRTLTVPCLNLPPRTAAPVKAPAPPLTGRGAAAIVWASLCVRPGLLLILPAIALVIIFAPKAAALPPQEWAKMVNLSPTVYKLNAPSVPAVLDPQLSSDAVESGHLRLIYEGLTRQDAAMRTVPGAASAWEYSADGRQVSFELREGLTYSDGSPLNAMRFEYALLRAIDPRSGAGNAGFLDRIEGAANFRLADAASLPAATLDELRAAVRISAKDGQGAPCVGYEQLDCRWLHITLTQPDFGFHTRMSSSLAYPLKQEILAAAAAGDQANLLAVDRQVGNGPFTLTRLDFSSHSEFVPNQRYWGAQPGYSLRVFYQPDSAAALAAYQSGDFDILPLAGDLPSGETGELGHQLRRQTGRCTTAVLIDASIAPFEDASVRAAFSSAISRETYIRDLLQGQAAPALTWIPPQLPGYRPLEPRWGYQPETARQTLAQSAYGGSAGLPAVTVSYTATPESSAAWQWLKARWQDVLGVEIALNPTLPMPNHDSPLKLVRWCGEIADPAGYLEQWQTGGELASQIHFSDAPYDALIAQAAAQPDPSMRLELYGQAQDRLAELVPAVLLYHDLTATLFRPELLPYATPFDALFPVDVDPAALVNVDTRLYMPVISK